MPTPASISPQFYIIAQSEKNAIAYFLVITHILPLRHGGYREKQKGSTQNCGVKTGLEANLS